MNFNVYRPFSLIFVNASIEAMPKLHCAFAPLEKHSKAMRKLHLYASIYFKLFSFVCFIKVYFIFSTSIFVFIIRIYIFASKHLAYENNRTSGLSQPHHLPFGQRDDYYPCRPAQGRQKLYAQAVAVRGERRLYVQAVYLLGSEETVAREFGNLRAIRDNYPKYVVSMDPVSGGLPEYPGIIHIHLRGFLMTDF